MAAPVNKAPRDANLWSLHEKMLAQPLKDNDVEVRLWVFSQVLLLEVLVQASDSYQKLAVFGTALWFGHRTGL